jgi:CRP/FNR family cyclic AMP-dependent transcriptional regulator
MLERHHFEDALSYLPCSAITEYRKGDLVYDADRPSPRLYLVLEGNVKVSRVGGHTETIMHLCRADDLFGELAFVQAAGERAAALETTKLMSWSTDAVRDLALRHPELGIALIQLLTRRCLDMAERVGSLAVDPTSRRLAKCLLGLAQRLGEPAGSSPGWQQMGPFPHKLLAQYIGTTREAVTHGMNRLRRDGVVNYTRRKIIIDTARLREVVDGAASLAAGAEVSTEARRQPLAA